MNSPETPHDPDPRVVELALHVMDEAPVDWEAARSTASDLSETLERLREIQALAMAHRRERVQQQSEHQDPAFLWGPLRVLDRLGEGGFAEVWRAWEPTLARPVALKLRRGDPRATDTSRWLKEAQRLARVRHPNVLQIYGADVHDGRPGLWTELVQGRTLEQRLLAEGPCGAPEAAVVGMQVCAALAAVHGAGLVHGDVKTRNVMREGAALGEGLAAGSGRIVLMDFGTASEAAAGGAPTSAAGTPLFAAPELLAGEMPSVASDLWALGVVLYRLVAGGFPFEATSMEELRGKLARRESTPLRERRPDLPAAFVHVVERLLEHDPARRFRSATDVERALAATLAPPSHPVGARAPLRGRVLAAVLGAATLALVLGAVRWVPEWTRPRFHLAPAGLPVAMQMVQAISDTATMSLYGLSEASPGDLDGDGHADLVVGAPDEQKSAGHVYVYRGLADGTFARWYELPGPAMGEFGSAVAGLGDLDGDGRPEFAIAAKIEDANGGGSGAVYVYRAADGPGAPPAARIPGQMQREQFGHSVAGVGDVNGDGFGDFVIGAPMNSGGAPGGGGAYLFLGGRTIPTRPALRLACTTPLAAFGISAAGLGDVNGDGFADYGVGANFDPTRGTGAGRVAVFYGGRAPRSDPDFNLYGRDGDCWFGTSLCGIGDADGDGFADFAVGAERDEGYAYRSGRVYVFHGGPQPRTEPSLALLGEARAGALGHSMTCGGDLDGDGHPDLAVGEFQLSDTRSIGGGVLVFGGGPKMDALADLRLLGDEEEGNFGWSVTSIPAVGGHGFAGLVVGSPYAHPGGSIHVYRFARFAFARPRRGERWAPQAEHTVSWLGPARAELEWASAAGGAWQPLEHGVGGRASNTVSVHLPRAASGPIRLRLRPTDGHVTGDAVSDTILVIRQL